MVFPDQNDIPLRVHLRLLLYNSSYPLMTAIQGAEQCGFCNPGMIMNAIALFREIPDPSEEEIKEYLAGNLCRCSGYEGQLRGILDFLEYKKNKDGGAE